MRKFLISIFILIFTVSAFALESPWDRKLPIKKATIYYLMNGSIKGKKTLYIKDYGKYRAEYVNSSMNVLGIVQKQREVTITTPDWQYQINLVEGRGTKQVNPNKYLNQEFYKLSKSKQKKVIANSKKMAFDIARQGSGTIKLNAVKILGYKCDKIIIMGITNYSIHNTDISLKSKGNLMGVNIDEKAIKIVKGKAPSSKFKIPKGIKITHDKMADKMMQAQAKQIIQDLLKGKLFNHPPKNNYQNKYKGGNNNQNYTPEQQKQIQEMMKMFGNQQ